MNHFIDTVIRFKISLFYNSTTIDLAPGTIFAGGLTTMDNFVTSFPVFDAKDLLHGLIEEINPQIRRDDIGHIGHTVQD
jgi:hypothetical protein